MTTDSFERPDDLGDRADPRVLFARSYLLIRTVVGLVGICLPIALLLLDAAFLREPITARGSLSAYYHSGARDLFVGTLCVTGVLLMTYLSGRRDTWDHWLSSVAGVAALGVALLPTARPDDVGVAATPLQLRLGEDVVSAAHFVCAAVFVLSLAGQAFVFAHRDRRRGGRVLIHQVCGAVILAAVAWAGLGFLLPLDIGWLTSLYLGEVVAVWAFGVSWLAKGHDLRRLFGRRRVTRDGPLSRRGS
ncbi:hypothetical protein [Nocardioides sp. SYSU DS0663]|uniref:hypothetical protein n=1 Tax=Nocardioides sp. SYSU DS0663 TaxID=3416445 RepID=UPI003F4B3E09